MESNLDRSFSDSDMQRVGQLTLPKLFASHPKRKRSNEMDIQMVKSTDDLTSFRDEIKNMFASLMKTQEQEFKKNAATLNNIQQTNSNIEKAVEFLSAQNEEFKKKIESLENKIKEDRKYIAILEDKIENMQLDSRKANFEIKNVPKKPNESKDDLMDLVVCLSKSITCDLKTTDIKDIYRIRGKRDGIVNTPIIVETYSTIIKNKIMKACKTFNIHQKTKLCAKHLGLRTSEDSPIFVTEQLTAKAARLHFLARDLVKTKKFKYCWTAYGRVYLRKDDDTRLILVHSEAQIQDLINAK